VVSLMCPFGRRRISIPARGSNCRHYECWDLQTYLTMNSELNQFLCFHCRQPVLPDQIELDTFFWNILKQIPPSQQGALDIDEVLVDGNALWKPSRSAIRLSESAAPKYNPVSPAAVAALGHHWSENSPSHHFPQELPRSLSTGRNTPRGGPNSVGHPLSMCSVTSDYGSPASLSAIVPVSPSAKSFPGSVGPSGPQESPAGSSLTHGGRTPVPQLSMQYSGVGSFPTTPKTPGMFENIFLLQLMLFALL
jgi:hypothetical protein